MSSPSSSDCEGPTQRRHSGSAATASSVVGGADAGGGGSRGAPGGRPLLERAAAVAASPPLSSSPDASPTLAGATLGDSLGVGAGVGAELEARREKDEQDSKDEDGEGEGVFEIRDFTSASSFERITHQITLACKKWAGIVRSPRDPQEELLFREEFGHKDFKYELVFQLVPQEHSAPCGASSSSSAPPPPPPPKPPPLGVDLPEAGACAGAGAADRLGLHTFPMRAHRLQRWFGVHHFVVVSVQGQSIDPDSARTVLSAAVLATRGVSPPLDPPLSCFVPVDQQGRRRRYLGELLHAGARTSFAVDQRNFVDSSLEHLEGLQAFFCKKFCEDPLQISRSLMMGARFTYLADNFEPWEVPVGASKGAAAAASSTSSQRRRPSVSCTSHTDGLADGGAVGGRAASGGVAEVDEAEDEDDDDDAEDEEGEEDEGGDGDDGGQELEDPVESIQLHCLWPSFPRDAFVDNAEYSDLDARLAPFWKVRIMRCAEAPLPLSRRLRSLLEFRKEARTVRSAGDSLHAQAPKTALASLTMAIQDSLESILLPSEKQLRSLVEQCMASPVTPASASTGGGCTDPGQRGGFFPPTPSAPSRPPSLRPPAALRGGRQGMRMAKFAELASGMRCFKGAVLLWCQVVAELRRQWDGLESSLPPGAATPASRCVGARGVRSEHLDFANCLSQQKFEMLQRSLENKVSGCLLAPAPTALAPSTEHAVLRLEATGEPIVTPQLLQAALLSEDMVLQLDMAAASIAEPCERAELFGRELRSDAAAFKEANPGAKLGDFLAWRAAVLGLGSEPFPQEWLSNLWEVVAPLPAESQGTPLFEPEREAEMALHYLENIEGTQLLLQVFRVLLCTTLEDLDAAASAAFSPSAASSPLSSSGCGGGGGEGASGGRGGGGAGVGGGGAMPAHLRMLRDRALAACTAAFSGRGAHDERGDGDSGGGDEEVDAMTTLVGEVDDFPEEQSLQAALEAVESFEAAARLAGSLSAKLPGEAVALVEDLLVEGEAAVTSDLQRVLIEELLDRSRKLDQISGREAIDDRGVFELVPFAKEFVLLLQPPPAAASIPSPQSGNASDGMGRSGVPLTKRMYVELREKHLRVAVARGFHIA